MSDVKGTTTLQGLLNLQSPSPPPRRKHRNKRIYATEEQLAEAKELYESSTLTNQRIAELTGLSPAIVSMYSRERGWKRPQGYSQQRKAAEARYAKSGDPAPIVEEEAPRIRRTTSQAVNPSANGDSDPVLPAGAPIPLPPWQSNILGATNAEAARALIAPPAPRRRLPGWLWGALWMVAAFIITVLITPFIGTLIEAYFDWARGILK